MVLGRLKNLFKSSVSGRIQRVPTAVEIRFALLKMTPMQKRLLEAVLRARCTAGNAPVAPLTDISPNSGRARLPDDGSARDAGHRPPLMGPARLSLEVLDRPPLTGGHSSP